jgi:hypothetical protein
MNGMTSAGYNPPDPAPERKPDHRWRIAGSIAAVAVLTIVGGVAWATSQSAHPANAGVQAADPTPSPSQPSGLPDEPGGRGGPRMKLFGMAGPALHGEFVVKKDGGGYQTIATQHGQVTAVSKDSITVKSEDGFSRTYVVTADTLVNAARDGIANIKDGNTVMVMATVADGKATALSVSDGTVRDAIRGKWGLPHKPR